MLFLGQGVSSDQCATENLSAPPPLIFQPPGRGLTIRGHFEAGPVGVEPSEGPSTLSAASVGGI